MLLKILRGWWGGGGGCNEFDIFFLSIYLRVKVSAIQFVRAAYACAIRETTREINLSYKNRTGRACKVHMLNVR